MAEEHDATDAPCSDDMNEDVSSQHDAADAPSSDDVNEDVSTRNDARTMFVGGLSWETTEKELRNYFGKYGEIETINIKIDPNTGRPKGFAFVDFKDAASIDAVVAAGKHFINNNKVDAIKAKPRHGNVFVGGLSAQLSEDDIRNYFGQYGKIVEMEFPFDKVKKQRKGFCFITFESLQVARDLIKTSKHTIKGKEVDVEKATPKPDPAGRGGQDWNQYGGFGQGYGDGDGADFYGGGGYGSYGGSYRGSYGSFGRGGFQGRKMRGRAEQRNSSNNGNEDDVTDNDARTMFVGGLNWETDENDLRDHFGKYGEIQTAIIKTDPITGRSKLFAFVIFKDAASIDAVIAGGEHVIKNKKVDVSKAKPRHGNVFVGGISPEVSSDIIKKHFGQYGKIVEVDLHLKVKNQRKGFCFITFESLQVARDLIKTYKHTINGKEVYVEKATPKPEPGAKGGQDWNQYGGFSQRYDYGDGADFYGDRADYHGDRLGDRADYYGDLADYHGDRLGDRADYFSDRADYHGDRLGDRADYYGDRADYHGDRADYHGDRLGDRADYHGDRVGDRADYYGDRADYHGDRADYHGDRLGDRADYHGDRLGGRADYHRGGGNESYEGPYLWSSYGRGLGRGLGRGGFQGRKMIGRAGQRIQNFQPY